VCSPTENRDWFEATIGGLGLTGVVTRAEIALVRVPSAAVRCGAAAFRGLKDFAARSAEAEAASAYVVAWLDTLSAASRGILFAGDHVDDPAVAPSRLRLRVPWDAPAWLLSPAFVRPFNSAYFRWHAHHAAPRHTHFTSFFFPLDAVADWNRLYGRRGFVQWQGLLAGVSWIDAATDILRRVAAGGGTSPLAVLKIMGTVPSNGMLSFARPGVTLALDFAFRGERTLRLLDELDRIALDTGGALYPAKDARMSPDAFRRAFPAWERFGRFRDPGLSSSFWRRVAE
jgi:FAD/FMN-containing dehydrogenase